MDNDEFRIAVTAFLRRWLTPEWFSEHGKEDFEVLNVTINGNIGSMFRTFHVEHGRFPEFDEMCPPDGPVIGIVPEI